MTPTDAPALLATMLNAIYRIADDTAGLTQGQFIDDVKTADAVLYNLQVLAECCVRLPEDFRHRFAHVPWDEIAGLRNLLLREREDETLDILWPFMTEELALLEKLLRGVGQVSG